MLSPWLEYRSHEGAALPKQLYRSSTFNLALTFSPVQTKMVSAIKNNHRSNKKKNIAFSYKNKLQLKE
jgi:hypothetical protein